MISQNFNELKYPFSLPILPYSFESLEPNLSSNTFKNHYYGHHQIYIENLNKLVKNTEYESLTLKNIILKSYADKDTSVFNNASQMLNHNYYWFSIGKNSSAINPHFEEAMVQSFGSIENFKEKFKSTPNFASAWLWLVMDQEKQLKIRVTNDAMSPIIFNEQPLLVCDLWEHAYYLDFQYRRANYLSTFLNNLMCFDYAQELAISTGLS